MENNENFVAEQAAENVEQTTEQTPKTYTQEEVDAIVGKRIARTEAKITKKFERKYGQLEEVLRAGTGKENVEEMTDTFRDFYIKKGVQMPQKPAFDDADIETLAQHDAQNIISGGIEEVEEEVDRLADIGIENMTAREKATFKVLAEYRQSTERGRELSKIGVTEDVYNSKEFNDFAKKFNPTIPISEVYEYYRKTQPQKEYKTPGSMKSNVSTNNGIKDFYTPEEAKKFTREELRKNPALMQKVEESMQRWYKK
jgi:hypothetical protein